MIRRARTTTALGSAGLLALTTLGALTFGSASPAGAAPEFDCAWAEDSSLTREDAFTRAADTTGVPVDLLKAISYMESRWENHRGQPSQDGGYGPMHLTDLQAAEAPGKGEKASDPDEVADSERTAHRASELTGIDVATLKSDAEANICGGAAVLSDYQEGSPTELAAWADSVARYGTGATGSSQVFANQVYATLATGKVHDLSTGERVKLKKNASVEQPFAKHATDADCPKGLDCEWIPAPYEKYNASLPDNTGSYGNHDKADRTGKGGPKITHILIHNTEGSYHGTINQVQDPTYVSWQYTLRSSDGHVAQHVRPDDVAWHAGNWYLNMHSIGLEHEGKAGTGSWFTESMMQSSSELTRYLARKHQIPLDRGHIIGHDQVPGITPGATAGVHWDPGPYFDWEHYFELLGAPLGGQGKATTDLTSGDVVTVRPGFADNPHPQITSCNQDSPGSGNCDPAAGTNFTVVRQGPSEDAALAKDIGEHPNGSASTWRVSDYSARATAGLRLVVSDIQGEWVKVSWAGEFGWIHNPASDPVLVKDRSPRKGSQGTFTIRLAEGDDSAPVYGRAYPEESAYPAEIPYQTVVPIEYTIKPGQEYVVTDRSVPADYYRAKSFDGSAPGDRVDVVGKDVYYQVDLAHRTFFVRAADVELTKN